MNYQNPEFYIEKVRNNFEIVDRVQINTLPTLHMIKDFYEVHMFEDGYIGVFNTNRNKYVKPHIGDKSSYYFRYGLRTINNTSRTTYMHRLVGLGWIEGWSEGMVIDHKDTNQLNNLADNLEWVMPIINTQRAIENGLKVGRPQVEKKVKPKITLLEKSQSYSKQLSFDDVVKVFELAEKGYNVSEIAKEFNVTGSCISQILSSKRWRTHPSSVLYRERSCG